MVNLNSLFAMKYKEKLESGEIDAIVEADEYEESQDNDNSFFRIQCETINATTYNSVPEGV